MEFTCCPARQAPVALAALVSVFGTMVFGWASSAANAQAPDASSQNTGAGAPRAVRVSEDPQFIHVDTPDLAAAVCKTGYVTGVAQQSFLDKKTGFRDPGFGLDIVDWIMEPGSDARLSRPPGPGDDLPQRRRVPSLPWIAAQA